MSTGHTPAPWHLNRAMMGQTLLGWHIAADPHGSSLPVCVSDKFSEHRDPNIEMMNALLISAAPDLLDALKWAVDEIAICTDEEARWKDCALDAIAKATGDRS